MSDPAGPTGYDIIALIIAGLGLILAVAALSWNIAEYRLSDPRVKVHLRIGARRDDAIISTRGAKPPDWQPLVSQGFKEPLLGIEVANVGRFATEVQSCNCRLPNGFGYFEEQYPGNPALPYRLESHATQTWWVPLVPVRAVAAASGQGGLTGQMEVQVTGPRTKQTERFFL
jgi:hypothetical protein